MLKKLCVLVVAAVSVECLAQGVMITDGGLMYPGGNIDYYASAQKQIIERAQQLCEQRNSIVEKIANISIQIVGDFILNEKTVVPPLDELTKAVTYQQVAFSAIVHCKN